MDHADPAHPGRGDEPGQVGDRSPAEGDHHVAAGEPDAPAHLPAEAGDGQRLALLGVRQLDPVRVQARGGQLGADVLGGDGERGRVHEQSRAGAETGDGGGEVVAHTATDQDRVGPLGPHLDAHRILPDARRVSHGATLRDAG